MSRPVARTSLFLLDDDLYAREPVIGQLLDEAARELDAGMHGPLDQAQRTACLARADAAALRANAAYAQLLGPGADPSVLLPLVRLAVEAIAHGPAYSAPRPAAPESSP